MRNMLLLSVQVIVLFLPALAHAHGDDHITGGSFIGPVLGFIVLVAVIKLGKVIIRTKIARG